jgi:hypothetical protein
MKFLSKPDMLLHRHFSRFQLVSHIMFWFTAKCGWIAQTEKIRIAAHATGRIFGAAGVSGQMPKFSPPIDPAGRSRFRAAQHGAFCI